MRTQSQTEVGAMPKPGEGEVPRPARRTSMHEGIAVWCDCCSCAAEPYWLEVAEELGIDLGSNYEDEPPAA
jgi:hypothetical protein